MDADQRKSPAPEGAYAGDKGLARLLAKAGSPLDVAAVRDLIAGVNAAPPGVAPGAWMALVAPRPDGDLAHQLDALRGEMARAAADGLDGGCPGGERLALLRGELTARGLDGFIIPRGDEHQGEYVARRSERLAWLTGFTGSAGMAVVLADRAAVFVDGRYTLQAAVEVDQAAFEIHHLTDEPPAAWIAANAGTGARLGHDPWLHTPAEVQRLGTAATRAAARLEAVADNPVDAVWADQPPPPVAPVVPHDLMFSGRISTDKRRDVAAVLAAEMEDAAVLAAPDSIAWLLNIRGGDVPFTPLPLCFAIIDAEGAVDLFIDRRKLAPGTDRHLGESVRVSDPEALGPALDDLGGAGRTVRLNSNGAPAWIAERLRRAGATVAAGSDPCQLPKARKNPVEIDGMRAAHRRDGAALSAFLAWLSTEAAGGNVDEISAAARLDEMRRRNEHFRGLSFPTISGAGANGAIVHYRATEATSRTLEPGTLFLLDSGAQYLDGTTDVTRTLAIGEPTAEMRERFTLVLKGHIAIATVLFPEGTTGAQIDILARQALWRAGLDYDHGTGHGVGSYLGVHEGPQRISKVPNRVALEPGMVVSNEPGYYKTGAYGIRIENLVTVTAVAGRDGAERDFLGFETLTLAPIDRTLVEPSMLDEAETGWLDTYHARVRSTLTPLLDEAAAGWLATATRPIA